MKKLENEIVKHGFTYKLVKRTKYVAWYQQWDAQGILAGNEIFYVVVAPPKFVFDREMPERELFPPTESFGITAWSVGIHTEYAERRFREIKESYKEFALTQK